MNMHGTTEFLLRKTIVVVEYFSEYREPNVVSQTIKADMESL